MSIRHGLLALLVEGDAYGNQLRVTFEERTGGTWPLNIGQVFQTLDRLARDGLVEVADAIGADGPPQARRRYALTPAGRAEVARWFVEPVTRIPAPRDELSIKLALGLGLPGVDADVVLDAQRGATMRTLQGLTALRRHQAAGNPAASARPWLLVLDRLIFDAEAELRWLDHCQATLVAPEVIR
jgi:DNA-binding PadR family transcriptional regulator